MQVSTVAMDRFDARKMYREYLAAEKEGGATTEDRVVKNAYREIGKGRRVVRLVDTIISAGCNPGGLPKLAATRADSRFCRIDRHGSQYRMWREESAIHWNSKPPILFRFSRDRVRWPHFEGENRYKGMRAVVPTIPPNLRPTKRLHCYTILWEAVWEPSPPVDPMLLRSIGGGLYVVVAHWDLTSVEQAVLAGRF